MVKYINTYKNGFPYCGSTRPPGTITHLKHLPIFKYFLYEFDPLLWTQPTPYFVKMLVL